MPKYVRPVFFPTSTDASYIPYFTTGSLAPLDLTVIPNTIEIEPEEPKEWECEYCETMNLLAECKGCGHPKTAKSKSFAEAVSEAVSEAVAEANAEAQRYKFDMAEALLREAKKRERRNTLMQALSTLAILIIFLCVVVALPLVLNTFK